MRRTSGNNALPVIENWGKLNYREAWERQKVAVANLLTNRKEKDATFPELIAAVEHPSVYTLGFHGNEQNMLATEEMLSRMGAECIRIERGGDITYHGPGQLVVYPIVDIASRGIGVKKYIELLEDSIIELLDNYGIKASSNPEAIGVWIDWGKPEARKICAIGVKVRHGVTMHGLALNISTDLSAFTIINPCGFTDKGVTSMEKEAGSSFNLDNVGLSLAKIIKNRIEASTIRG